MTVATRPHLRPLGIGQLLDQAIRLYRRNFFKFIGIIVIVQVPLSLLQLGSSLLTLSDFVPQIPNFRDAAPTAPFPPFGLNYFLGVLGSILLLFIGPVLIYGVASAALARSVADNYLGKSTGIIEAYRKISSDWGRLIIALVIAILLLIGLFIWTIFVPCVGWFTGPGVLAFFWMVIVPLIAPIIVLEKHSGLGIHRAWDLTRRRFWWVLGFAFLLVLFGQLIIAGPTMLINFLFQLLIGNPFRALSSPSILIWQTVIQSLVTLIFTLIYLPLQLVGMVLLYFDLRVRTEGLDLILLAEGVSSEQTSVTDIAGQTPQSEWGNWITMTEVGYFALTTVGTISIVFILWMLGVGILLAMFGASGGFPGF
jgi:hypothetical protein